MEEVVVLGVLAINLQLSSDMLFMLDKYYIRRYNI